MAGKTLLPTEGGIGIAAGSPFTPFHYTIVTNASPALIANGRLAQLADAEQSIIAPGVLAGGVSLVLGNAVIDAVGGDRSILLGHAITQNSGGALQAEKQILIGSQINMAGLSIGCQQLILIGDDPVFPVTGVQPDKSYSVCIGHDLNLETPNQFEPYRQNVQIGHASHLIGTGGVCIGFQSLCLAGSQHVAVGFQAQANAQSVSIGYQAQSSSFPNLAQANVVIGRRATGHEGSITIGQSAGRGVTHTNCIMIGWEAGNGNNSSGVSDSLMFGYSTGATASNAIAIGNGTIVTLPNVCAIGNAAAHPLVGLALGVTPALSGMLRLPSLSSIMIRNTTNTVDTAVFAQNAFDWLIMGDLGQQTFVQGSQVQLNANGILWTLDLAGNFSPAADAAHDLGITATNRIRDIFLSGQINQDGANGAAAGTVLLTNAPTSNVVQYVPFTFNGAAGWLPWIPA